MRELEVTLTEAEFTTLTSIANGIDTSDPDVGWIADMETLLTRLELAAGPQRCASENNGKYTSPCANLADDAIHAPPEAGCRYPDEHHEFAP